MYDFKIDAADKASLYRDLIEAADALTAGEPDPIANMANLAALLWESLPDLNWAGFYRNVGGELVLGPFQGRPASIRIPFGKGVCGTAAARRETLIVPDVLAFPGHIACDSRSKRGTTRRTSVRSASMTSRCDGAGSDVEQECEAGDSCVRCASHPVLLMCNDSIKGARRATTVRSRGRSGQWLGLCAHDQKPQRDRHLSKENRKGDAEGHIQILR